MIEMLRCVSILAKVQISQGTHLFSGSAVNVLKLTLINSTVSQLLEISTLIDLISAIQNLSTKSNR